MVEGSFGGGAQALTDLRPALSQRQRRDEVTAQDGEGDQSGDGQFQGIAFHFSLTKIRAAGRRRHRLRQGRGR